MCDDRPNIWYGRRVDLPNTLKLFNEYSIVSDDVIWLNICCREEKRWQKKADKGDINKLSIVDLRSFEYLQAWHIRMEEPDKIGCQKC